MATITDPTTALTAPEPYYSPIQWLDTLVGAAGELLSPTEWILFVLRELGFVDVNQWLDDNFKGDTEGIAKCAGALKNLGTFSANIGTGLKELRTGVRVDADWQGNAAEAFSSYITELESTCEQLKEQVTALADMIRDTAEAGQKKIDILVGLLKGICDGVVLLAVEAAAASATSWCPVGWIIWVLAGAELLYIASQISKALEVPTQLFDLSYVLTHDISSALSGIHALVTNVRIPAAGWDFKYA